MVVLLPYVSGGSGAPSGWWIELGVIAGLVLGDTVKWGMRRGLRHLGAPQGRHQRAAARVGH